MGKEGGVFCLHQFLKEIELVFCVNWFLVNDVKSNSTFGKVSDHLNHKLEFYVQSRAIVKSLISDIKSLTAHEFYIGISDLFILLMSI